MFVDHGSADDVRSLLNTPTADKGTQSESRSSQAKEQRLNYLPAGNCGTVLFMTRSMGATLRVVDEKIITDVYRMDEGRRWHL
jgi:hypothetical protein